MKEERKKIIKILLTTLILVVIAFIPNKASAWTRQIKEVDQEGSRHTLHFTMGTDGILHWDSVDGATGYTIVVYFTTNYEYFSDNTLTTTQYDLVNKLDARDADNVPYKVEVIPKNGSGNMTSKVDEFRYDSYSSPYEKLEAPSNLRWNGKKAEWNAVTHGNKYQVDLYNANGDYVKGELITGTSYDFTSYNPTSGYWFTVRAYSTSTSPNYRSSKSNESPRYAGGTRQIKQLDQDGSRHTLHFTMGNDGILHWSSVDGATGYRIVVYFTTNYEYFSDNNLTTTQYNLVSALDSREADNVPYKVQVIPTNGSGNMTSKVDEFRYDSYASPYEQLEAPSNLRWNGKTAEWDTVTHGNKYQVDLYKANGDYVKGELITGTSYDFTNYYPADGYWFTVTAYSTSTSPTYRNSTMNESPRYEPGIIINELSATITEPTAGKTPNDLTLTSGDPSKYTVEVFDWFDSHGGFGNSETFIAGETYQVGIRFTAKPGYEIADLATFTINGVVSTITYNTNEKGMIFTIPEGETKTISVKCYNLDTNEVDSGGDVSLRTDKGGGSWKTKDTRKATLNTNVEINALPYDDFEFVEWRKESPTGPVFKTNSYSTFTSTEDITLYAMFRKKVQKVSYTTHVQSYGWQDYVSNGEMSGTSGQAKRLEGIKIKLENQEFTGDIEYRTHIQSYGWEENYKKNDEMSGTEGQAKRLEAIQIRLTGEMATYYDVYYRVHAQSFGWLGWARNNEEAGTAGFAKRLEGIEIILVPKGTLVPGYGTEEAYKYKKILYTTHVQTYGWQDYTYDGNMAGTSGEAKRLEAIKIKLNDQKYTGDVEYRTHIQSYGWEENYKKNDQISGTSGEAKRLEAIQIRLTGQMKANYDIYYRVHAQSFGWLAWAKNGEQAGTAGLAKRLEGIEIVLVDKGESPPQRDNSNSNLPFINNN